MATATPVASTQVADTSAFGGPNATQAAAANAALAAQVPTSNNPVPVTAPAGQTSTSAPAASPTTVVSTQPATTAVGQMGQTLTQAQIDLQNSQSIKAAQAYNLAHPQTTTTGGGAQAGADATKAGTPGYDVFGNLVNTQTPEQQIASQPDTGNVFIYDSKGTQSQWKIGTPLPPGYTTSNPTQGPTTPTTDQTTDSVGNVYKQFSDGTYGKFNAMGAYVGAASAADFTQSKTAEGILSSLDQVIHGTYPLTANQQAQVDGIKAQFAQLMQQQAVANANFTGGVTVAENLYGMGNSITGLGEIKGSIDAGLAKIADLNSKMTSAVAQMEAGFQTDNFNMLKGAYDLYSSAQKSRQDELDKLKQAAVDAQNKQDELMMQQKQLEATANNAIDSSIRSVMDEAGKGGATAAQVQAMNKALANHDYAGAVQAAGGSLQDPTSPAGQYSAYVKKQQAVNKPAMSAGDFLAAQKYKEAYASASASAAAQSAYTESDKNQSKLEHNLQQAALSSRSDLGIQNKKVSTAIDLRAMMNQFKDAKGNYNVPATNYTELALGLATLLSPTGVPAQSIVQDLKQKTAQGDLAGALTYITGDQYSGSTQNILKTLSESIDRQGQTAEQLRNKELDAQTPSDLDPSRASNVVGKLPSYDKMSNGDISYQTPEQINTTAVAALAGFAKSNPDAYAALAKAFPLASPTWIAQQAGLLPKSQ